MNYFVYCGQTKHYYEAPYKLFTNINAYAPHYFLFTIMV